MKIIKTELPGILIIEPKFIGDERGFFMETWHREYYTGFNLPRDFVQDNVSFSHKGVLRGLHFQNPNQQAKLIFVLQGEVFDVAVDVRVGSPTFGKWFGITLSAKDRRQLYIPPGFAHGFCVIADEALFVYKCTEKYDASSELGILWSDPDIDIQWPCSTPELSEKDKTNPRLRDLDKRRLPVYRNEQSA
jgi:dTDP-4-dehydrorhamnose 3,5-epimerase